VTELTGLNMSFLISGINLTLSASSWWYILLALVAVSLAYFVYRFTLPPVSKARRVLLWSLRGAALILILFMLFEPVLVYLLNRQELPSVAVLVDKSASMSIKDASVERSTLVRELLSSSPIQKLVDRTKLHFIAFSDTAQEVPKSTLRELKYDGVGTDPAGALAKSEDDLSGKNLAAIVLISDGSQNLGSNPVRIAKESTVPIYTIGLGDTSNRVDAAITEMLTNEMTYVGSKVPIDVRIHAYGIKNKSSVLHVMAGGKEISRQVVSFPDNESDVSINVSFLAETAGDLRVRTVLDSIAGETILENNSRSVIV
jgi:hypothetical protein